MLTLEKLDRARSLGPVVVDIAGRELAKREIERLRHPLVGAVILFTRNYSTPEELLALTGAIHAVRPRILITVDHEGGRVQRFREGFTEIPAMSDFLEFGDKAPGLLAAAGFILASELRAVGVDFSFTPVLDIDYGRSAVIGNRSLGKTPAEVERNARGLMAGLRAGGMASCGKHFPGHGWAEADSHVSLPRDERARKTVLSDLDVYRGLASELDSLMTAHVAYDGFNQETATFSEVLLKDVLRQEIGFPGLVFSDDLSMKGAGTGESVAARAHRALRAGCDMVLHCNHPEEADEILRDLEWDRPEGFSERLAGLLPDAGIPLGLEALRSTERWKRSFGRLRDAALL